MSQALTIETIPTDLLAERVRALKADGFRLVQISATQLAEEVEVTYSFDRDILLTNLRVSVPASNLRLPSISALYGSAFLYENEIYDLFRVKVEGMNVDFGGNLYKTTVKFPFATRKTTVPASAPATAQAAPAATPAASTPAAQPAAVK
jgi:ech hydrogenase subunit D